MATSVLGMTSPLALRALPPRVALFQWRARRLAESAGHAWGLEAAASPTDTIISGTSELREKKLARRRAPATVPSTPSSTVAPATPQS